MRIDEFYKKILSMEGKESMEKFILYNASLVIAGIKPSETLTIKKNLSNIYKNWTTSGIEFINSIGMKFTLLRENDDALIILIYNEKLLTNTLFESNNNEFLMRLGYPTHGCLIKFLEILIDRYGNYNCPHELGIFLGIPLADVQDFMDCSPKKCLCCRYWKVYNDFNNAQLIFNRYDAVKNEALNCILMGDSSYNLANNIRNFHIVA